jgi:serine/threonine protein phosphatase PrpC
MPNNRDKGGELSLNWEDIRSLPTTKPTSLTYAVGVGSDPGKRKKLNEDSIFAASSTGNTLLSPLSYGLFVVADGQGAYANGQDASCCAIQAMVNCILPKMVRGHTFQPEACSALLAEAVQLANEAVYQQNIGLHNREGTDVDVGVLTTVTAAMVIGSTAYVANVGNSRTYLYCAGRGLKQITTDHSVVARLVEDGILTPEDVYTHLHRNQIYRALFDQPLVEVDVFTVSLHLGDTLLLCSDGLWNVVRDPKIEDILSQAPLDPFKATKVLIQAALDSGSPDNVSVIVVSMREAQNQMLRPDVQLFAKPDSVHLPQA